MRRAKERALRLYSLWVVGLKALFVYEVNMSLEKPEDPKPDPKPTTEEEPYTEPTTEEEPATDDPAA